MESVTIEKCREGLDVLFYEYELRTPARVRAHIDGSTTVAELVEALRKQDPARVNRAISGHRNFMANYTYGKHEVSPISEYVLLVTARMWPCDQKFQHEVYDFLRGPIARGDAVAWLNGLLEMMEQLTPKD